MQRSAPSEHMLDEKVHCGYLHCDEQVPCGIGCRGPSRRRQRHLPSRIDPPCPAGTHRFIVAMIWCWRRTPVMLLGTTSLIILR